MSLRKLSNFEAPMLKTVHYVTSRFSIQSGFCSYGNNVTFKLFFRMYLSNFCSKYLSDFCIQSEEKSVNFSVPRFFWEKCHSRAEIWQPWNVVTIFRKGNDEQYQNQHNISVLLCFTSYTINGGMMFPNKISDCDISAQKPGLTFPHKISRQNCIFGTT